MSLLPATQDDNEPSLQTLIGQIRVSSPIWNAVRTELSCPTIPPL